MGGGGKVLVRHNRAVKVFLETERLLLRRLEYDDIEDLVELDSDPQVMRFINGGRATPRCEIENEVLPAFLGHYERYGGLGFWAVEEKSTGRFVGWFHLRPAEEAPAGEVELGYRLLRSAWGKGYATEGSRALIDKGFAELGVERVVASTMVVNVASRRVMERRVCGSCGSSTSRGLITSRARRRATSSTRSSDPSGSRRGPSSWERLPKRRRKGSRVG